MHIHRRIREQESPRSYWPGTVGAAPCLIPIVYDMGERSLYREPLETLSENAVASIPKIDKVGRGTRTPALWQESVPVLSPWVKSCCLDIPFPVTFHPSRYVSTVKRLFSSVCRYHRRNSMYPILHPPYRLFFSDAVPFMVFDNYIWCPSYSWYQIWIISPHCIHLY